MARYVQHFQYLNSRFTLTLFHIAHRQVKLLIHIVYLLMLKVVFNIVVYLSLSLYSILLYLKVIVVKCVFV